MAMIDERIELLINRRIDGALSDAESLELDKALIRSPQARALLADYQADADLAAATLQSALDPPAPNMTATPAIGKNISTPAGKRGWWMAASRYAAGFVAAMLLGGVVAGLSNRSPVPGQNVATTESTESIVGQKRWNDPVVPDRQFERDMHIVSVDAPREDPRREDRRLERRIIGIFDEQTQSLYLLEADVARSATSSIRMSY